MVPECRNRPEPVVNNQQYPFSSGVDDDRSRSKDEDSVETKISNSDDDRVGARKDLACLRNAFSTFTPSNCIFLVAKRTI